MASALVLQRDGSIRFKSFAVTLTILGIMTSVKLVWLPQVLATRGYPDWYELKCYHMCVNLSCGVKLCFHERMVMVAAMIQNPVRNALPFGNLFMLSWFKVQAIIPKIIISVVLAAPLVWTIHCRSSPAQHFPEFTCQSNNVACAVMCFPWTLWWCHSIGGYRTPGLWSCRTSHFLLSFSNKKLRWCSETWTSLPVHHLACQRLIPELESLADLKKNADEGL